MKKQDKLYEHFVDLLLGEFPIAKGLSFEQITSAFCRALFECGVISGEFELKAKIEGARKKTPLGICLKELPD